MGAAFQAIRIGLAKKKYAPELPLGRKPLLKGNL